MQIYCRSTTDGKWGMQLSGRLDFSRRQEFLDSLERFPETLPALAEIEVNCAGLSYIDSSGLGLLLVLRDRARLRGCTVALVDCRAEVRNLLNAVQFGRLFGMR